MASELHERARSCQIGRIHQWGKLHMARLRPFRSIKPSEWLLLTDSGVAREHDRVQLGDSNGGKELTRQWILRELIDTYNYPREWLGTRIHAIGQNNDFQCHEEMFGVCILTEDRSPFFIAAIGEPGQAESMAEALSHCLHAYPYAGIGLATDGSVSGTRFLRRRFDTDKCDFVLDLDTYVKPGIAPGSQPFVPEQRTPTTDSFIGSRLLAPLSERVEEVFFEAQCHIRDIDGMHDDEALDELCKVLYAKLFDEEQAPQAGAYRMQRWLYGSNEEFAASVRAVYEDATQYDIRVFALKIPQYARSRGVFSTPIRLSSPALTRVVETLQEYSLTNSGADVKGRAFQKVLTPGIRAGMGQYFTPHQVIEFAVSVAQPTVSDLILDPFSGSAHFLTACLKYVRKSGAEERSWYEFAFGKLHGIEKSDRMVRIAMTDLRLHGDGHSNIRCTDALLAIENYPDLQPESFDLILTNPPFGSLLGVSAMSQLGKFALAQSKTSVPLEVLGLERCLQFLRPGGRLVIILPDGVLANRQARYVREWLERQVKLRAIVSLPIETFSPFGANIKTSILFMRKWRSGEPRETNYPVFLARIDNVGYDATGRERAASELGEVAGAACDFLSKEGW